MEPGARHLVAGASAGLRRRTPRITTHSESLSRARRTLRRKIATDPRARVSDSRPRTEQMAQALAASCPYPGRSRRVVYVAGSHPRVDGRAAARPLGAL